MVLSMNLTDAQKSIQDEAIVFARKNKKRIAKHLTNKEVFIPEQIPVSVFMAGSPGAGKTEASIELIENLASTVKVLRLDPDQLRMEFEAYKGNNSYLFQPAVSILVEKIHDLALRQKQSFLLDGTLANYNIADSNISRSIEKGRLVQILYVYQDPLLAWEFVQLREIEEGRKILPKHFVEQYFSARSTVNQLKAKYGKSISVDLLHKEIDNSNRSYKANIDQIDNHVSEKYTPATLSQAISVKLS